MFWDNFIFYCNKKGVAPNVAASDVGVKSSGTVTGWKNGAIPRQGVLKRLADYFCVSVSDLIGEQKEKPASEEAGFNPTMEDWLNAIDRMSREEMRAVMSRVMERYAGEDK